MSRSKSTRKTRKQRFKVISIKKEFSWVDDQGNRLVDVNQVEYSFSKE